MIESYDAEAAIIGGLLLFPDECSKAIEILKPDDFENSLAADAFRIVFTAYKQEKKIDSAVFQSSDATKEVKEFALLAAKQFLSTSNYDAYINTVSNNSGKRRITEQMQELLVNGSDYQEIINRLSQIVDDENKNAEKDDCEFLADYVASFDRPLNPASRIQTGFYRLDRALGGLRKGSLCYIGAYPSTGKTAFACNIMLKNLKDKKRIQFFSLEMSREQILDRLFSAGLQIDYNKLDEKRISEEEQIHIVDGAGKLLNTKSLSIEDRIYSVEAIAGKISKFKPDLVIIDFLQNIRTAGKYQTRKNQIDYISSELKRLARVNDCVIITLSQLVRSNDKPTMTSLKESGNLEADGDYVMLLYRPYVTDKSGQYPPEKTEVLLDKNKFGICGKVDMTFIGRYQKFEEPENRYEER